MVQLDRYAEWLDLRTDYGETIRIPADYLAHARHGYALTGHVSQGESVDRTFVLASPERGGAEWAYVAGSRQRLDLQVFVVHPESENVEEALGRAWSRSQAKSLALEMVEPARGDAAVAAVRSDLDGATPERLIARVEELRAAREAARQAASTEDTEPAWVAELRAKVGRAEEGVRDAEARAARLEERLDRIPAWRRGERAQVRTGIEGAERDARRNRARGSSAHAELTRLAPVVGGDARARTQELSVELSEVERRLESWRGAALSARELPDPVRQHERPPIDRGLSR